MGTPSGGDPFHFRRFGWCVQVVRPSNSGSDCQVAGGENVRPAQREHKEHLRGPDPDAFHLGQMFDDQCVFEAVKQLKRDCPALRVLGEFPDIFGLLAGKPKLPHFLDAQFHNPGGRQFSRHRIQQSSEDDAGDLSAQLLVDDRADERLEARVAKRHRARPHLFNDRRQNRIFVEMRVDFRHYETEAYRDASAQSLPHT